MKLGAVIASILISFLSWCHSEIPDQFYKLPLTGSRNGHRDERTATLLEPVESETTHLPGPERTCDGACISTRACKYYGGSSSGTCINGNICCKFERTCEGVSREKISFFTSPSFPDFATDNVHCSLLVYPNEDVCSLRIDFLELNISKGMKFAGNFYKCIQDNVFVLNTLDGPHDSLCEFQGYSAVFKVQPKSSRPVVLLFIMQSNNFRWKLRITQINCNNLPPWKNNPTCGRQLIYEPETRHQTEEFVAELSTDADSVIAPLIVNGAPAEPREFPWLASIQVNFKHRCGASIINEHFILSAAHCFVGRVYEPVENLRIVVGDFILDSNEDGGNPQILSVETVIIDYSYKSFQAHINDIALIKVREKIIFTHAIQPVCMPTADIVIPQEDAVVSGWGRLNATYTPRLNKLQKLAMKIIPNKECENMHLREIARAANLNASTVSASLPPSRLMGNQIQHLCALPDTTSTVCFGDSGGPLVMQNPDDGRFVQVGIVSFGLGACDVTKEAPVAFTRVSEFLRFISLVTTDKM